MVVVAAAGFAGLVHCSSTTTAGTTSENGVDGPPSAATNPNVHQKGNAASGQAVFRNATFGNEGFWTDAVKLPQGIVAAGVTPVMALKLGLSVDVDALDPATKAAVAAEIAAMGTAGPILNDPATTVKLINANAIIGVVVKEYGGDPAKLDVMNGDKMGLSCAVCHSIADHSVLDVPNGGSIGKRLDGPAAHTLDVGSILAAAANSRALYPMLQLKGADGMSTGRAPSAAGLTKTSTEAEVDAYFSNKAYYPVGMFDDTVDGVGNPMHITPFFRTDLAAPWGSAGEFQFLDQFGNTVYTVLLDLTDLTTPDGQAFLHTLAGAAGDTLHDDYVSVLAATGVTGYPYVKGHAGVTTTGNPGKPDNAVGLAVDHQMNIDMNAYLDGLRAPPGRTPTDAAAVTRARAVFRSTGQCTQCHNVDQSKFVPPMIVDMKTIFPGDAPVMVGPREPPLNPVEDTPGNTFDDKMIVVNASIRGLARGAALPLLMDLARKPVFLHDNSVPTLDNLLDPARGASAPHPFYLADTAQRSDMVQFLQSLDDTSK
jgi:cytochrome c2